MDQFDESRTPLNPSPVTCHPSLRWLPLILSCIAIVLAFLGLIESDVPLTRYVRSLYHPIGYLLNPWLYQFSDAGDRLGRGESLVILSLVVLAVGFGLKDAVWKSAGWQSLLAHGIAALVSNVAKHVVGRPRPKFMHAGPIELSPAGGSGWDSFPSGHATASFAVAAVIAVRFPRTRWFVFALALAIASSRILRGAHFLTDAVGGAAIGYLVGTVVARPWREWRASVVSGCATGALALSSLLLVVWTIGSPLTAEGPLPLLQAAGIVVVLLGLIGRAMPDIRPAFTPGWWSRSHAMVLIATGFSLLTGSLWVLATVTCAAAAVWLQSRTAAAATAEDLDSTRFPPLAREAAFALLVVCAVVALIELRGALPMR